MHRILLTTALLTFSSAAFAQGNGQYYKWTDENGVVHYQDSIPPEYSDLKKEVITEHDVVVREIEGRKTDEEIAAEKRARELEIQKELQARADKALLATYLSVDEIEMHRDRRVELFQAQSRVTELFLTNLEARLERLEREASRYQPYAEDEDAAMVDPALVDEINDTRRTIERHQANLAKFQQEEKVIYARFEGDINRFKTLKGIQ